MNLTPRQIKSAIEGIQQVIDKKRERLAIEPERLKRNLLKSQIKGRERIIESLEKQLPCQPQNKNSKEP